MRRVVALGSSAVVALTVSACGGASSAGSGGSQASTTAYCNQVRQVQQAETAVQANPDQLKNAFAVFDKLTAVSPSQVAPSVRTLSGFYNRVLSALGSASLSDKTALQNAVTSAIKGQQTQVQGAAQKFNDYTKRTCGIDLSGSPSGSGSTTSTTH